MADHSAANLELGLGVGKRIEVFWPLDAAWYSGTITALNGTKGVVDYDDGERGGRAVLGPGCGGGNSRVRTPRSRRAVALALCARAQATLRS